MSKTKQKMSITRALATVKVLESKLGKTFNGFDVVISGKLKSFPQFTKEEFTKNVLAEQTSFNDLFENRLKIKSAIAKANIETKVKLGEKTYSIIELIDLKSSASFKLNLYTSLITNYTRCNIEVHNLETKIEAEVSKQVEVTHSNKNQVSKDIVSTLTSTYTELWSGTIVGLDINQITKEKLELETLLSEIDMTLSEINSKTEIEVEL